jgi:hypothetical protein
MSKPSSSLMHNVTLAKQIKSYHMLSIYPITINNPINSPLVFGAHARDQYLVGQGKLQPSLICRVRSSIRVVAHESIVQLPHRPEVGSSPVLDFGRDVFAIQQTSAQEY